MSVFSFLLFFWSIPPRDRETLPVLFSRIGERSVLFGVCAFLHTCCFYLPYCLSLCLGLSLSLPPLVLSLSLLSLFPPPFPPTLSISPSTLPCLPTATVPQTLERSYLLKINGTIVERPQHMLMRVSIGIHKVRYRWNGEVHEAVHCVCVHKLTG